MKKLSELTLDQKIGQVLCFGYPGADPEKGMKELLRDTHMGGIIIFARNLKDCDSLRQTLMEVQEEAIRQDGAPLLIGIDQEGGLVTRLYKGATFFPGAMSTAAAGKVEYAYEIGKAMGAEMLALGINFNFSPVLDINTNPDNPIIGTRAYGDTREQVTVYASAYTKGLQETVIATGKHFPGHGDTHQDSHLTLPKVDHPRERLDNEELYPFRQLVKEGIKAIMTTHIVFPAYDPSGLPATISEPILTGLLRKDMGFEGIIITDCMEMKAISDFYGTAEAVKMALNAGADMILVCHTRAVMLDCIAKLKEACLADPALMAKLDRAVERLLKYKGEIPATSDEATYRKVVGCEAHKELAAKVSRESMTVYKGKCPIYKAEDKFTAVFFGSRPLTGVEDSDVRSILERRFREEYKNAEIYSLPVNPSAEAAADLLTKIKPQDKILIFSYNAALAEAQGKLIKQILDINPEAAVISTRAPYDVRKFPDIKNYIIAYEQTPIATETIFKMLRGEFVPTGKAPVDLLKGMN